jgi:hypothetical protein
VGQACRCRFSRPRARFPLCPADHTYQPSLTSLSHDPPSWTRPRPRVLRPCPRARTPFEPRALLAHLPLLTCALCQTPSPSLSLCPRKQRAPPQLTVGCSPFCDHHRARAPSFASVSFASSLAARDTLRCAPLSGLPDPRSPEQFLHSRAPPPSPCRVPAPPSLPRDSSASPRGEQPAHALNLAFIAWLARDCSPELPHAAVSPPRCVQCPLVLPRRCDAHGRVRQTTLNALELVPKPLEPRRGQPPCLQ